MSRYIDADAAYEAACEGADNWDGGCSPYRDDCIREELDKVPTVDAVPVARCEKCRHGIKIHGISDGWVLCTKPYVTDTVGAMMHRADWFCADGERRTL